MKLRIFILFLFLPILRVQAGIIDSLMIHPRDSIGLTSDSLVLRYLQESGIPISDNNKVKLLKSGREKFIDLFEAIREAKHHVHLEYFNFRNDSIANALFALLAEKVKEGVEVRAMFDAFGNWSNNKPLKKRHLKKIREQGIEIVKFDPFTFPYINHAAHRDHRKILVIDGKVAFTGGVNLADEYINRKERFGHWKDTAILLRGEAVQSFTLMFLQMWNLTEKEPRWDEALLPSPPVEAEGYVMPYCDCPLDDYKVGESVYMDILNRAKDYVHIMTPYLILDNEMETALKFAAQRGVDVKLILPGIPDKKAAYALAKSHYQYLTAAGVKLYEYTPGFVHAKIFASDDVKAVVGTINLDYRSLYHHFEDAVWMVDAPCIRDIEQDFQHTLEQCRTVENTSASIWQKHYLLRATGMLLKVIAPLL